MCLKMTPEANTVPYFSKLHDSIHLSALVAGLMSQASKW